MATPNANPSSFSNPLHQGEATNNHTDESEILIDKDQTSKVDVKNLKRAMKNTDRAFDTLEDLPPDFIRGEVDVLDQMNKAADALDSSLRGIPDRSSLDSPRGELGSSFKNTPGGIEEVAAKTDEYLASHGLKKKPSKHSH
ncbi:hypothetical protein [Bdellovibrio sp. HCB209]|uniref:hypothetical protein n=1 Tax=Bdellovibrio sp. HCB209 TaxID=3394354 RepID=UPI0039B6E34D